MADYVTAGAALKCSFGDQTCSLKVIDHKVSIKGQPQANVTDSKPNINIPPFGKCSSMTNPTVAAATAANQGRLKEMPCVPAISGTWLGGKTNVLIDGAPALLNSSKLCCNWRGQISIEDCGQ